MAFNKNRKRIQSFPREGDGPSFAYESPLLRFQTKGAEFISLIGANQWHGGEK